MNKELVFRIISALCIIPMTLVSILILGCRQDPGELKEKVIEAFGEDELEITEIVLCRTVAADFTPIEPTEVYPAGTKEIFLSVRFDNLGPENILKARWFFYGTSEVISEQEFQTDKVLSGYNSFNIKVKEGFPPGDYSVSVFLDEELLDEIEFLVE